jgi:hypothetical protein
MKFDILRVKLGLCKMKVDIIRVKLGLHDED